MCWGDWGAAVTAVSYDMAAMLATPEDIDANLGGQPPPYKPPDSLHCDANDLKVPKSHNVESRSESAHLWEDSAG